MRYRNSECNFTPDEIESSDIRVDASRGCMDNSCGKMNMDWNSKDGWYNKDDWYNKGDRYNKDDRYNKKTDNCDCDCEKPNECAEDLKRRLSELQFAAIDLNLFLDTHPCDEEALKMFKKITKTMESLKYDYIKKHGPLMAWDSSDEAPFQWASEQFKWPWER